MYGLIEGFTV